MRLKNVCLVLVVVVLLLLLSEIDCIANYNQAENLINDEDRRAAEAYNLDQSKAEANKRGLYETSGSHNGHQTYPSGYGEATFTSPGYAHSYTPSSVAQYYPVPSYSTGHSSYGSFGQSAHGGGYGYSHSGPPHGHEQSAHAGGYGYGHSAPAQGHGHGGLTLKGLLIPLAGIALLGAAAALSTNPVLLQLGVVNGRRRRRRSVGPRPYLSPR